MKNGFYQKFEPLQVQRPDRPWHHEKDFVSEWCHEPLKIECLYNEWYNCVRDFNVNPTSYYNLLAWLDKRFQLRKDHALKFVDEKKCANELLKGNPVSLFYSHKPFYDSYKKTPFNVRIAYQNNDNKRIYYGDEWPALGYEYIISYNGINIVGDYTFITPQMDSGVVTITTANSQRTSLNVLLEGVDNNTDYKFFNNIAHGSTEVMEGEYNCFKKYVEPNRVLLGAAGEAIKELKKYYGFGTERLPRYSLHVYTDDYECSDDDSDSDVCTDDDMIF